MPAPSAAPATNTCATAATSAARPPWSRPAASSASSPRTPSPTTTRSTAAPSSRRATRCASTPRGSPRSGRSSTPRASPATTRPTAPSATVGPACSTKNGSRDHVARQHRSRTSTAPTTPPSLLRDRQHPGELDRDQRVAVTLGTLAPYANFADRPHRRNRRRRHRQDRPRVARRDHLDRRPGRAGAASTTARPKPKSAYKRPARFTCWSNRTIPSCGSSSWPPPSTAQPGEEVEFTLRFDNVGDRVIGNVTIIDSLTTRLEYVDGTPEVARSRPSSDPGQRRRLAQAAVGDRRAAQTRRRRRHPVPLQGADDEGLRLSARL